jgi:flagellar basal body-associated protein FliL
MASACKSAAGCIEAREPVRATYVNLYKWPESDAEFVRSLTMKNTRAKDAYHQCDIDYAGNEKRNQGQSPVMVDSYSCRQIYLRSYTFSKKESMPEKTVKYLGIVRDKVASFPFLHQNEENLDSSSSSSITINSEKENKKKQKKKKKKKKKKECVSTAKKLCEVSCNVVLMIFHRLLACAASVDVVDR